jgi:hypothetical protein
MVVKSIKIKPNKPYKFLRCRPINGHSLNIATFEIYGSDSIKRKAANSIQRILARPISKSIAYDSAFDSNILTYITRPSLEVTFDSPVVLSEVRFAPRNSNNAVTIGDRYELFYYDKAWISLGEKKAEGNFLIYNNAPSDAMYWLRDLDTGHEEQAFLYKMNRQYFINDDKDVYQMFNHHTK